MSKRLEKLAADNIRILAAEAVQKANSGHPGMPMGCADLAFTLFYKYMKHNPANPNWLGRDRFVLSAGHGSMLIYSLLHLFEYGLTIDDLKQFRQWGSLTPGHPEFGHTTGVEVTTGPLGSGFATAVGMAMAAKLFAAKIGFKKSDILKKRKIYTLCGDGCMMEGTTHEAASLAGHLKLDNMICFYDSNKITIEGSTSLAFTENVPLRYEAYGWRVITIEDANDIEQIEKGIEEALKTDGRPTFVVCKTQIGFGSPNKQGKNSAHGEPLGEEELLNTKKNLGFPETPFYVNEEVKKACAARVEELKKQAAKWDHEFNKILEVNPIAARKVSKVLNKTLPDNLLEELLKVTPTDKPAASRASSGIVLQKVSELVLALAGGSADLAPSTKTWVDKEDAFGPEKRNGRNFHFGVRELGMGFIINGMALYGTTIPYGATFAVFSDYMKPAIRLAALQKLNLVYVFTHDSIFVGEDGPTHQPIEQLAMMRSIPGMTVIRPADANEVAHAWNVAVRRQGPVALLLTRQNLNPIPPELAKNIDLEKGAYVLSDDENYDILVIATGSEVNLSMDAAGILRKSGIKVRVVSMPSRELFLEQSDEYQNKVIPKEFKNIVSVELGTTFGWGKFVGKEGLAVGLDHFGDSAPYKKLSDEYGFVPEKLATKDLFRLFRDWYQGTEYDLSKGDGAGPFGNINRFDTRVKGGSWERAISLYRTYYSYIAQCRKDLPDPVGGIFWWGCAAPHATCYVPFYCGASRIPEAYSIGYNKKMNKNSAWWAFNYVANIMNIKFSYMLKDVQIQQELTETQEFAAVNFLDKKGSELYKSNKNAAIELITEYCNENAVNVYKDWWKLADDLIVKYQNGYLVSEKGVGRLQYPKEWLKQANDYNPISYKNK